LIKEITTITKTIIIINLKEKEDVKRNCYIGEGGGREIKQGSS
jgi:hypothetical protein